MSEERVEAVRENPARRSTRTVTTTTVQHVAKPMGFKRENGPHLIDLRDFVEACHGLPDDLVVRIDFANLDSAGRRNVTFRIQHEEQQA